MIRYNPRVSKVVGGTISKNQSQSITVVNSNNLSDENKKYLEYLIGKQGNGFFKIEN